MDLVEKMAGEVGSVLGSRRCLLWLWLPGQAPAAAKKLMKVFLPVIAAQLKRMA